MLSIMVLFCCTRNGLVYYEFHNGEGESLPWICRYASSVVRVSILPFLYTFLWLPSLAWITAGTLPSHDTRRECHHRAMAVGPVFSLARPFPRRAVAAVAAISVQGPAHHLQDQVAALGPQVCLPCTPLLSESQRLHSCLLCEFWSQWGIQRSGPQQFVLQMGL